MPGVVAYIGLGANLGDARASVLQAMDAIAALPQTTLRRRSGLYRSAPVEAAGPDFINAVVEIVTELSAPALLGALQLKHAHLRHAMLARSLLVIDEVHASDAYMTRLTEHLLRFHHTLLMVSHDRDLLDRLCNAVVGLDGKGGRPFFTPLAAATGAASQMALDPTLRADQLAAGFTAAPGDNGNALALATLIDQPVLDGGRSNFQSFYSSITATLGFDVQRAQSDESRATDQQAALSAQQQAVIGVSTDEEMAQVLAYQRAFEASSRFVQVVDEMLQRLVQVT